MPGAIIDGIADMISFQMTSDDSVVAIIPHFWDAAGKRQAREGYKVSLRNFILGKFSASYYKLHFFNYPLMYFICTM